MPPGLSLSKAAHVQMPNVLPDKYPAPGWERQFEVEAARELLPDVDELVAHPRYGKTPALCGEKLSRAAVWNLSASASLDLSGIQNPSRRIKAEILCHPED